MKQLDRLLPRYARKPLLFCLVFQFAVYYGGIYLAQGRPALQISLPLDASIPLLPGFIVVYYASYVFWGVNYILVARDSHANCRYLFYTDLAAKLICGAFFVLMPTTALRPEVTGQGLFPDLIRTLHRIDPALNFFPSLHCLLGWTCWRMLRRCPSVSKGYRLFSFFMALAICASTLFTGQHVILDVFGGVFFGEVAMFAGDRLTRRKGKGGKQA